MLITNCRIDVGDDNVAIKAGKKIAGQEFQSEDITVTDCTFLHGHGMSIGSETSGGVRNITVKNCTFENTENGLRIKSDARRGGLVENISYSDITMSNVVPAITFTCFYQNNSSGDAKRGTAPQADAAPVSGDKLPVYRNIRVTNLKATSLKSAGMIMGIAGQLHFERGVRQRADFCAEGFDHSQCEGDSVHEFEDFGGRGCAGYFRERRGERFDGRKPK